MAVTNVGPDDDRPEPLSDRIEQAIEWMRRAALTSPDQHAVPSLFVRWSRRLCRQDFAALALPSTGDDFRLRFADGLASAQGGADADATLPAPLSRARIQETIDLGRPQLVPGAEHPTFILIPYISPWSSPRAVLVVSARRDPCCYSSGHPIDLQLLSECASSAAKLARQRRRARVAEMIATTTKASEELHDHVIQSLVADGFEIQATGLSITDPAHRSRLAKVTRNLDDTIERLRGTIFELSHSLPPLPANLLDHLLADTAGLGTATGMSVLVDVHPLIVDAISDRLGTQIRELVRAMLPSSSTVVPAVSVDVVVEPIGAYLRLSLRQSDGPDQSDLWRSILAGETLPGADLLGEPVFVRSSDGLPVVSWSAPLDLT